MRPVPSVPFEYVDQPLGYVREVSLRLPAALDVEKGGGEVRDNFPLPFILGIEIFPRGLGEPISELPAPNFPVGEAVQELSYLWIH